MEYSTQPTGTGARILRTNPLSRTSEVVTTVPDLECARRLVMALSAELSAFGGEDWAPQPGIVRDALRAGPAPAGLRRRALSAFDRTLAGDPPASGEWHVVDAAVAIARLVLDQSDAVRRAVRDELARLYDGLDGPIVVATVTTLYARGPVSRVVVNDFLESASDDELAELADPGTGDSAAPYALCDRFADLLADTLDAATSLDLVEVEIDRPALEAWCRAAGRLMDPGA